LREARASRKPAPTVSRWYWMVRACPVCGSMQVLVRGKDLAALCLRAALTASGVVPGPHFWM
jgi:hypothetical protein